MILVDANYVLRFLTRPNTPRDEAQARIVQRFFQEAAIGPREFTIAEAVLAEIFYVLNSPRQYAVPAPEVVMRLKPILELRGCKMPGKRLYLRALDIAASSPPLGFVDALNIAMAEQPDTELATFDRHFDDIQGIARFQPER